MDLFLVFDKSFCFKGISLGLGVVKWRVVVGSVNFYLRVFKILMVRWRFDF